MSEGISTGGAGSPQAPAGYTRSRPNDAGAGFGLLAGCMDFAGFFSRPAMMNCQHHGDCYKGEFAKRTDADEGFNSPRLHLFRYRTGNSMPKKGLCTGSVGKKFLDNFHFFLAEHINTGPYVKADEPSTFDWPTCYDSFTDDNSLKAEPGQVARNRRIVRDFVTVTGIDRPASIRPGHISSYLSRMARTGRGLKTLINARSAISRFCRFAKARGLMDTNPAREVEIQTPEEVPPPVLDSRLTIERVVAVAALNGVGAAVALAVWSGLRLGELCRLAWADVDCRGRTLMVRKAKSRKPRVVSLCQGAIAALEAQRTLTGGLRWVFPARRTFTGGFVYKDKPCGVNAMLRRLKPVQDRFPEFRELPGRSVGRGFHLFRHTFASRAAENNVTDKKIQTALGHSDPRMTGRYTHLRRAYDPEIEKVMK